MTINNGDTIEAADLNLVFSDAPTGLSEGLDAQRDLNSGYVSFRFRIQNPDHGVEYKQSFMSPDDLDIYLVGMRVNTLLPLATFQGPVKFTAKIDGSTGDFETDLPTQPHLFLMEPVSNNAVGEYTEKMMMSVQTLASIEDVFKSSRYATYDLDSNRPCNTLLKGAEYDVTMTMVDDITGLVYSVGGACDDYLFEIFIVCKTKLRRN
jgi:hypothetical protein